MFLRYLLVFACCSKVPPDVSSEGKGVAEGNAREVGDEPLQEDTVVVAVVHDRLQGQLLWELFGLVLLRGGRWLGAGPMQDEGEVAVGLEALPEFSGSELQCTHGLLNGLKDHLLVALEFSGGMLQ